MNRITWVVALFMTLLLPACEIPRTVVGGGGSDRFKVAPEVFRWQKVGQFGNTDPEQRKEDMIECGVNPKYNFESPIGAIFHVGQGETVEQMLARERYFRQCIKDKGYVQLGLEECGPVKENRGICK